MSHTPEITYEGCAGVGVMTKAKLKNPVTSSNYNNENKHHQHQQRTTWSEKKSLEKYFSPFGAFQKLARTRVQQLGYIVPHNLYGFQKVKQLICAWLLGLSMYLNTIYSGPLSPISNYGCDRTSPYKVHASHFIICWMASLKRSCMGNLDEWKAVLCVYEMWNVFVYAWCNEAL